MNLSDGASRIASPAERLPGRRLPISLSVGAASLALALVLGATPLAASAPVAERLEAKVSTPPDTTGLHPVDYSLERLGPFSSGLAAVRQQGKWGYVDKTGKLAIPFRFEEATRFGGNWASVRERGRWRIVDRSGQAVSIPRPLARLSRFSEGLAAAKASAEGKWGYVDETGTFLIPPQFDRADDFSQGLAAVALGDRWFYVTPRGAIALVTPYYRSYSFTADGLALFQETREGKYGYVRQDGKVAIPATYAEARPFSEGLAPVRMGSRWGYITTKGVMKVSALWSEAYPFAGGVALVLGGPRSFSFVDAGGDQVHDRTYAHAEGYSEGVAIVGDGKRFWYVDAAGAPLPIGQAVLPAAGDDATCSTVSQGVSTNYMNGVAFFQIVNQTDLTWSVAGKDYGQAGPDSYSFMLANPGIPKIVDAKTGPNAGRLAFVYWYPSFTGYPSGTYDLFDLTLTATDGSASPPVPWTVVLANSDNYTSPPPPTGHPWWAYLAMAEEMLEGMFSAATGDWEIGFVDILNSSYDIASGTTDGDGSDNDNSKTDNVLQTILTGSAGTGSLQPLNGGFCGGDSYTISDGKTYVFALTTIKSDSMPPTIQLTISPFSAYFAQNAIGKLDMFRRGKEPSAVAYTTPLQSCVYTIAMNNWSDATDFKPCSYERSDGSSYDYFTRASSFPPEVALDWWSFANNLDNSANSIGDVQAWMRYFGGRCGTVPASCPNSVPMTASPTSFDATTQESVCQCVVQLTNAAAPVRAVVLPPSWFVNPGQCDSSTPPLHCSYTIAAPAGANGTVQLSDALTTIPISVKCSAQQMIVQPLSYSSSSFGNLAGCTFTVSVAAPQGPVTVTPNTFVTKNDCFKGISSCTVELKVPPDTKQQRVDLSDGITTQPITVQCTVPILSNTQPGQDYYTWSGYGSCPQEIDYVNARGSVVVPPSVQSWLAANTCIGTQAACSMTFNVSVGASDLGWFPTDGYSTSVDNASLSCQPCDNGADVRMTSLPWGANYVTSAALGYKNGVQLNCFGLPLSVVQVPPGGSVDLSACTTTKACNVVSYAPVGGDFVIQGSNSGQVSFHVSVEN